jgi:hypothetical protein
VGGNTCVPTMPLVLLEAGRDVRQLPELRRGELLVCQILNAQHMLMSRRGTRVHSLVARGHAKFSGISTGGSCLGYSLVTHAAASDTNMSKGIPEIAEAMQYASTRVTPEGKMRDVFDSEASI